MPGAELRSGAGEAVISRVRPYGMAASRRAEGHRRASGCGDWAPPPKIDNALVKALARAHRWRRLLEEGRFGTLAELADAERISRSYVRRVLRLTLLAPDIVEHILDGQRAPELAQLMQPFPSAWERQWE
jgi:hypothetical protein